MMRNTFTDVDENSWYYKDILEDEILKNLSPIVAKYYNDFAGRVVKAVFNAMQKYKGTEDEEITTSQMQEILGEI